MFSTNSVGKTDFTGNVMKLDSYPTQYTKIYAKWTRHLKIRAKSVRLTKKMQSFIFLIMGKAVILFLFSDKAAKTQTANEKQIFNEINGITSKLKSLVH